MGCYYLEYHLEIYFYEIQRALFPKQCLEIHFSLRRLSCISHIKVLRDGLFGCLPDSYYTTDHFIASSHLYSTVNSNSLVKRFNLKNVIKIANAVGLARLTRMPLTHGSMV